MAKLPDPIGSQGKFLCPTDIFSGFSGSNEY